MQYRKLGKIDWKVSALGFGAMRLPTRRNPLDLRVDQKASIRMIRRAVELGVNYFDTGWPYHLGASEKVLGQALSGGYREKVFLVTKLPMFLVKKKEDFDKYLDKQLEKLQTDYLDGYLFHGMNERWFAKVRDLGLIEKMEQARADGRIRHIGFSFHDTMYVFKQIVDYYDWDLAQIQYNYLDTTIQATTEGLRYAHGKGLAVVIMEPLKGGQLAKPPREARELLRQTDAARTPVDWALQFLWNLPEVSVVLSGMSSLRMVEENCRSAHNSGIGSLGARELETLQKIISIYQERILVPCTSCRYCMPCPWGVNIPENFALINLANSKPNNIVDYFFRKILVGKYKRLATSRDKLKQDSPNGAAALCTDCGSCVPKCPQRIAIPGELAKVHEVMKKKRKIADVFGG